MCQAHKLIIDLGNISFKPKIIIQDNISQLLFLKASSSSENITFGFTLRFFWNSDSVHRKLVYFELLNNATNIVQLLPKLFMHIMSSKGIPKQFVLKVVYQYI